jgi:putative oxidoreductase
MAFGLLIIRCALGLLLFGHGTQKLFGWFGGHGLAGTGGFFESVGHRPGRTMAGLAGLSEATGGMLLALGLVTPLGAAMVIGVMVVAAVSVHAPHGLWHTDGAYELPLLNGLIACGLAFTGAGAWSFDAAIGWSPAGWGWGLGATVLGLAAATAQLARRAATTPAEAYPAETAMPAATPVPSDLDITR